MHTILKRRALGVLGACGVIVLIGCSGDDSSTKSTTGTKAPIVEKVDDLGLEVDVNSSTAPKWDNDAEFEFDLDEEVSVGGVKHHVTVHEVDEQVSKGGHETLTVTDVSSGQTSKFGFDPALSSIIFTVDGEQVTVVQNPDKTYSLNGAPSGNGKATFLAFKALSLYAKISAHGLLAAYMSAETPAPDLSRGCPPGGCDQAQGNAASPVAVCVLMKDFCDCVACDKAGKADCSLCK